MQNVIIIRMRWIRLSDTKNNLDKIYIILAECYVIGPIVIFLWGWTLLPYAIVGTLVFIAFGFKLFKSCKCDDEIRLFSKDKRFYWLYAAVIVIAWVYLSGIGGFAYQNGDFWTRNPTYRDLATCSWPVVFDFSSQSELVRQVCGPNTAAFSYYFCWWLPACLVAKVFGMGEVARNIVLMLWAVLGLYLIVYLLCRKLQGCIWYIPVMLIMFSGLDSIPYWIQNNFSESFPWVNHIEFWSQFFQYSSNTTQLFWVFNQSIPIWLLVALMLQQKDARCLGAIAAIAFAYSPWATFGMVPYAIYGSAKGKKQFVEAVNVINYGVILLMVCIFGVFYMGGAGDSSSIHFIFSMYKGSKMYVLRYYLEFVFFEALIFFVVLGRTRIRDEYYWVTLIELIIIPLFVVRDNNFVMRSSIPALFMLMYYVINGMRENKSDTDIAFRVKKGILVVVVCLGMMTPLREVNRGIINTISQEKILEDPVVSFANMRTEEQWRIEVIKNQFFAYDYEKMPFFKY